MTSRITIITFCALLLAFSFPAQAQQAGRVARIGYLSGGAASSGASPNEKAFLQGLRDLGYVEGKNIVLEYRSAEAKPERIPSLVAELLQLKVDVFVSSNANAIRVANQINNLIPIVMIASVDPVAEGLVDSLARPGRNITGVARLTRELSGKRLELLKEVVPKISRVGVLWAVGFSEIVFKEYETAARPLKIELQSLEVRGPDADLEGAFREAIKGRATGLIIVRDVVLTRNRTQIAELAKKNRLPSMCERTDYVEAGCLMSYSSNDAESFRRAATYVDKILKGTKPVDLPVEQAMKFEFVVNLKTTKQIGLTIPPNVLVRADRVIKDAQEGGGNRQ